MTQREDVVFVSGEPPDQREPEQPAPDGAGPRQQGRRPRHRPHCSQPPQQLKV